MFLRCFCSSPFKSSYSNKSKFFDFVSTRLTDKEIFMLQLIYDDLSSRNTNHFLIYDNFLVFFHLTGLWGAKLFHEFDQDHGQVISLQQFLFGILARTAKAPLKQKIDLLYSFFEGKQEEGVTFKNFTTMLYNYSRQQLKEILIEDGLIPNRDYDYEAKKTPKSEKEIVQLNYEQPKTKKESSGFEQAYKDLLESNNPVTCLQIKTHDFKYKIKYSNMNTLIQQFVAKVFAQHNINVDDENFGRLSFNNFSNWIKSHKKLFRSYYSAFRTDLWEFDDGEPSYFKKIQNDFVGKYVSSDHKSKVYVMLAGDVLILCQNKKSKQNPFKVICMQGLNVREVEKNGIQISHHCDCYKKSTFFFEREEEKQKWWNILKIYEAGSLYLNYHIGQVIGTGNFSIVYKCTQKQTGRIYALKMIQLQKLTDRAIKLIRNQSQIMKIINHPQIIKYKEKIQTKTHQYLITEYIYGQDLFQYVKKRKCLNQFESAFIIGQIIKAVMHLHKLQILHRDLKPQNIMVIFKEKKENQIFQCTSPGIREGQRIQSIKIIDFGLSNHISELQKLPKHEKGAGTPNYIAPQAILGNTTPTFKADNFAIGSILYFLLRGKLPFVGKNAQTTFLNTLNGSYDIQDEHWDRISLQGKDLMTKLLEVDPQDRIELEQAVNHEWFAAVFERTKQSSKSISENPLSEDIREQDLKNLNLKQKKRKYSDEYLQVPESPRQDRYSK